MTSMNSLDSREKIFIVIAFLYILYYAVPIFAAYVPISVETVSLITVIGCGILFPHSLISKPMLWLYTFLAILFIYGMTGSYFHINGLSNNTIGATTKILIEAAWITPPVMIAVILSENGNLKLVKWIGWGSLIVLTLSFIYILPLLYSTNYFLREIALNDIAEVDIPIGLPDYTLMHSYPLILPGLCLAFRKSALNGKLIFGTLTLLFYYIILQTAVTTSIGISTVFIIFALIVSKRDINKPLFIFVAIVILLMFFYENEWLLSFIEWLMPYFEGTPVAEKLQDFYDSISVGHITGGTIEGRRNFHELSLQSFYSNPIFGGNEVGRHSHIFDILGSMGLFGFIPFIMIIISIYQLYVPEIKNHFDRIFLYSCFAIAIIYLYSKGIFGATGWLFTYVLGPCLVISVVKSDFFKMPFIKPFKD